MRLWGLVALCMALAGCTLQPVRVSPFYGAIRSIQHPFVTIHDHGDQCGPAALAGVLRVLGSPVSADDLRNSMYMPARSGTLGIEMTATARRRGMLVLPVEHQQQGLVQALRQGATPILLVNLSLPWVPRWHYVVVTGVDPLHQQWQVQVGRGHDPEYWSDRVLGHVWHRSGYWAISVFHPKHLPHDLALDDALDAALALERVRPEQAAAVYEQLMAAHPDDPRLPDLLANALREAGRKREAGYWYRLQVVRFAKQWQGWNDWLTWLMIQGDGCQQAGRQAVHHAQIFQQQADAGVLRATLHSWRHHCGHDDAVPAAGSVWRGVQPKMVVTEHNVEPLHSSREEPGLP